MARTRRVRRSSRYTPFAWCAAIAALALVAACGDEAEPPATTSSAATAAVQSTEAAASATAELDAAMPDATPSEPRAWELPRTGEVAGALLGSSDRPPGWDDGSLVFPDDNYLIPLSQVTADDLTGFEPFRTRRGGSFTFSPDGGLLAFTEGSHSVAGSLLRVVDTERLGRAHESDTEPFDIATWTIDGEAVELRGFLPFAWSPDGALLYGMRASVTSHASELWVAQPATGEAWRLAEFESRGWGQPLIAPNGRALYLLQYDSQQCCGIEIEGNPFVLAIDLETGDVRGQVELPGLLIGQRFESLVDGQEEYNVIRSPGPAIAPDGSAIYIVHSDEDRVTVIDTETMTAAAPEDIHRPSSTMARFGGWLLGRFADRAEAKGGVYRSKDAAVSADGRWLYVSGHDSEVCASQPYFPCIDGPAGLQVIDLTSMKLVHEEPEVGLFVVGANGTRILGWGWQRDTRDDPPGDNTVEHVTTHFGLRVIDAASHELIAHHFAGARVADVAISQDGAFAFVVSAGPGTPEDTESRCMRECWQLSVIDLSNGAITATRLFDSAWVFLLGF